jgi:hypothetical protein
MLAQVEGLVLEGRALEQVHFNDRVAEDEVSQPGHRAPYLGPAAPAPGDGGYSGRGGYDDNDFARPEYSQDERHDSLL